MRKNAFILITLIAVILGAVFLFTMTSRKEGRFPSEREMHSDAGQGDQDHWFNIHLKNRKIGYANIRSFPEGDGIVLIESIFMRDNILGDVVQNYRQKTEAFLNPDYSLRSFEYESDFGNRSISSRGRFAQGMLDLVVMSAGTTTRRKIPVGPEIHLPPAVIPAMARLNPRPGNTHVFSVFNPMTMTVDTAFVTSIGIEPAPAYLEAPPEAMRISIRSSLGFIQAWIGDRGGIWAMETGSDVTQVRTTRYNALFSLPADEKTGPTPRVVESDRPLPDPLTLKRLTVVLNGWKGPFPDADGERQQLEGNRVTIRAESLDDLPGDKDRAFEEEIITDLMDETMYIQSGIPEIREAAAWISSTQDPPLERVRKIVAWVSQNLETSNRSSERLRDAEKNTHSGDFHEHAIMTAALARAAGLPAHIETGLMYRDNGFRYHAWNRIYVGRWITCDAFLNQIPADVSHVRLASGFQVFQTDVFNRIEDLRIEIVKYE